MISDNIKPYGIFTIQLIDPNTNEVVEEQTKKNLIVDTSFNIFYDLLAKGKSSSKIGLLALGKGGIYNNILRTPEPKETGLYEEMYRSTINETVKVVNDISDPLKNPSVVFRAKILAQEGNGGGGNIFNEAGLFSADGVNMFSKVTFESVFKTSDFIVQVEWKIVWQIDKTKLQKPNTPTISGKRVGEIYENTTSSKLTTLFIQWNDTKDSLTMNDPSNKFQLKIINNTTIEIWNKNQFDYESDPTYYPIEILAKNNHNITTTTIVGITILNKTTGAGEVPPTVESATFNLNENNTTVSTVGVLTFNSNSPTQTFSIISGGSNFTIDNNGVVKTKKSFDYETDPTEYNMVVKITTANGSDTANVKVRINDVVVGSGEERPTITGTERIIRAENTPAQTVGAYLFDLKGSSFVSIALLTSKTAHQNLFSINIDPNDANKILLKTKQAFDYETMDHSYTFNIEIKSDMGSAKQSVTYVVTDVVEATKPILPDETTHNHVIMEVDNNHQSYRIPILSDGGDTPTQWEFQVKNSSNNWIPYTNSSWNHASFHKHEINRSTGVISVYATQPRVNGDYFSNLILDNNEIKSFDYNEFYTIDVVTTEHNQYNDMVTKNYRVRCKNSAGWSNWSIATIHCKNKAMSDSEFRNVMKTRENYKQLDLLNVRRVKNLAMGLGRLGYNKTDLRVNSLLRWNTSRVTSIAKFVSHNNDRLPIYFSTVFWNLDSLDTTNYKNIFNFVYRDFHHTQAGGSVGFSHKLDKFKYGFLKALHVSLRSDNMFSSSWKKSTSNNEMRTYVEADGGCPIVEFNHQNILGKGFNYGHLDTNSIISWNHHPELTRYTLLDYSFFNKAGSHISDRSLNQYYQASNGIINLQYVDAPKLMNQNLNINNGDNKDLSFFVGGSCNAINTMYLGFYDEDDKLIALNTNGSNYYSKTLV